MSAETEAAVVVRCCDPCRHCCLRLRQSVGLPTTTALTSITSTVMIARLRLLYAGRLVLFYKAVGLWICGSVRPSVPQNGQIYIK